jgi:hypothetical protein
MHDLHTIAKLNAETFGPAITNFQAQGRYVVANYTGLHILSIETFEDPLEAVSALNAPVDSPDVTRKIYPPTASRPFKRDQSEDRKPDVTLADYVERKQALCGLDENGCDRN